MAIEFMDNFSQYGTNESYMLDGVWAELASNNGLSPTLAVDPDGVSTGYVLHATRGTARKVLSSAQTTVGVAFRYWAANLPSSTGDRPQILAFCDANNSPQVSVVLETTGILSVYRGTTTTLLGSTAVPVLTAGAWSHVETKVLFSQTVGTVEIRVNGAVVLDLDTLDTCNTALVECSQIRIGANNSSNSEGYFKDLLIWNDSGSLNNDFMGDCQIVSLIPDGDDSLNWTTSSGTTGFDLINEATPNDSSYISADSTPPAESVFTLSDLEPEVVTVKGLMTFVRALKTDGGTANLQVSMVSGVDEDAGSDRAITVAATTWMDVSETDPATASAWTPISVNAAKLKIDRTT